MFHHTHTEHAPRGTSHDRTAAAVAGRAVRVVINDGVVRGMARIYHARDITFT